MTSILYPEPKAAGTIVGQNVIEHLGISAEDVSATPRAEGEPYMRHGEHEERSPHETERNAPSRCLGTLRIQPEVSTAAVMVVQCDVCGEQTSIATGVIDADQVERGRRQRGRLPKLFAGRPYEKRPECKLARDVLRAWVAQLDNGGDLLPAPALWGKLGRGKSHLLVVAAEALLRRGRDAAYWSLPELLDEMTEQFGAESRAWERALSVEILVLDDPGAERGTDWRRDRLDLLVDHRYRNEAPILMATNCPPENWNALFGPRTADRLRGMTIPVEYRGAASWRQQQIPTTERSAA